MSWRLRYEDGTASAVQSTANAALALWPAVGHTRAWLQQQVATRPGETTSWDYASTDLSVSPVTYVVNLAPTPVAVPNATPTPQPTTSPSLTASVDQNGVVSYS